MSNSVTYSSTMMLAYTNESKFVFLCPCTPIVSVARSKENQSLTVLCTGWRLDARTACEFPDQRPRENLRKVRTKHREGTTILKFYARRKHRE